MSNPKFRESLQQGVSAAKVGNKLLARLHLAEATEHDPDNQYGWLWMAWVAESPTNAVNFLERALACDPGNRVALAGLSFSKAMAGFEFSSAGEPSFPEIPELMNFGTAAGVAAEPVAEEQWGTDFAPPTEEAVVEQESWGQAETVEESATEEPPAWAEVETSVEESPAVEEAPVAEETGEWGAEAEETFEEVVGAEESAAIVDETAPVAEEQWTEAVAEEPPPAEPAWQEPLVAEEPAMEAPVEEAASFASMETVMEMSLPPVASAIEQVAIPEMEAPPEPLAEVEPAAVVEETLAAEAPVNPDAQETLQMTSPAYEESSSIAEVATGEWETHQWPAEAPTETPPAEGVGFTAEEFQPEVEMPTSAAIELPAAEEPVAEEAVAESEAVAEEMVAEESAMEAPAEEAVEGETAEQWSEVEGFAEEEAVAEEGAVGEEAGEAGAEGEYAEEAYAEEPVAEEEGYYEEGQPGEYAEEYAEEEGQLPLDEMTPEAEVAPAGGEAGWEEEERPAERRKILVVDDSPTVCKIVAITLEKRGHKVIAASNGDDAMSMIAETRPDLILLDITMPGTDGYQLCKLIKGYESTKNIPVVMLSGKDGFFDKMRAKFAGCQDYVTKPFDPETLVQKVEYYLPYEYGNGNDA